MKPFTSHPYMLLNEDDISVFQANWVDKATNLEAIANALNIGVDALVFLDDNPAERAQVRAALPTVAVPELPSDPSILLRDWRQPVISKPFHIPRMIILDFSHIRPMRSELR